MRAQPLPLADAHSDLLLELTHFHAEANPFAARWLPKLRAGGLRTQVCALYAEGNVIPELGLRQALGQSLPSFWLAILLILWFGVDLHVLPIGGRSGFESLIMPAVTLAIVPLVTIARITRSSVSSVLPQDFVRTAEAMGLRRRTVLRRHVLRNGLIPVVTVGGIAMGQLLSGAVITEQIFTWPGVGWLTIQAIEARDYAVVQAVTLLTAAIIVGLNLLVDFLYFALDPRIREAQVAPA
ncbi:MAG: ABC transporter permease subunit [Mycolicibacterium hassiacum]|uniref:ABC transporter permease n=1 Tax=Mycolicibacterium hassiacum TaxID=46351 RepID=UPI0023FA25A9|nr:ABC transporter permease [Mycolicibacterium hassiacum]MBX5485430.1 ABC transporter permease subunit [Mycolicibacterium hassiacum]